MNLLALDLGTKTGYCYNDGSDFYCGTWTLMTPREVALQRLARIDRRNDARVTGLFGAIQLIRTQHKFDAILFEDVMFSTYTLQTQLWASLRAALWLACRDVFIDCVPTGTLKKFAGHGSASKEMMGLFLCKHDTRFCRIGQSNPKIFWRKTEEQVVPIDDNAVDAVWIWRWGQQNLGRI